MKTLFDVLQLETPNVEGAPSVVRTLENSDWKSMSAKEFAQAVLDSPEFRWYVISNLKTGDLPPAIILRFMDYNWGKPAEKVIHTGDADAPIVTEIRRVIVRSHELDDLEQPAQKHQVTH